MVGGGGGGGVGGVDGVWRVAVMVRRCLSLSVVVSRWSPIVLFDKKEVHELRHGLPLHPVRVAVLVILHLIHPNLQNGLQGLEQRWDTHCRRKA